MSRPKVGVFAFTSCEGCSLQILNLEEQILDLVGRVEFVNFREAIDARREDYDIAIIDGAITREHEIAEIKEIRRKAAVLVSMGSCAVQGGLYFLKNYHDPNETVKYVYGNMAGHFDTLPVRPVAQYVPVDYNIYGCPINKKEFVEVITSIILGRKPNIPDYPICNECRMAENVCVFEKGLTCMGPATRAGCGAICPAHGTGCCGCRGPMEDPPFDQHRAIMLEHGVDKEGWFEWFKEFNGWYAEAHEKPENKG